MKNLCLIFLLALLSVSCASEYITMTRPNGVSVTCRKPPPEVLPTNTAVDFKASIPKIKEIIEARGSLEQKYERIHLEIPDLYSTQVMHYLMCQDYGNGLWEKSYYEQFIKLLPMFKNNVSQHNTATPDATHVAQQQAAPNSSDQENSTLGRPKMLPKGARVNARLSKGIARVSISGVKLSNVEFYSSSGKMNLGAVNEFEIKLNEGRRFNFVFSVEGTLHYALLSSDMKAVSFIGKNIEIDCSDKRGCAFKIMSES